MLRWSILLVGLVGSRRSGEVSFAASLLIDRGCGATCGGAGLDRMAACCGCLAWLAARAVQLCSASVEMKLVHPVGADVVVDRGQQALPVQQLLEALMRTLLLSS